MRTTRSIVAAVSVGIVAVATAAASTHAAAHPAAAPASARHIGALAIARAGGYDPPTPKDCTDGGGSPCYGPTQLLAAYGVTGLHKAGNSGQGRTICVLDSFGSPTAAKDLSVFSTAYGLPQAKLTIVAPAGPIPPFVDSDDRDGWAGETSLDIQWAHAFAPLAAIRLIVTPTSETEGIVGFPDMRKALVHEISHNACDVVSMSFGATEPTFDFPKQILSLHRAMFVPAAAKGVTLLSASGDTGAVDYKKDMSLYRTPVDSWPSTDPLVTSVGGTMIDLSDSGRRLSDDEAWGGGLGASGGGLSAVFQRPSWQAGVKGVVGTRRGTPDISMDAAPESGVVVRETFSPTQVAARGPWSVEGGTSAATPMMAGIVALADQRAGKRIGQLNPLLYGPLQKGAHGEAGNGIVDVRLGRTDINGVSNPDGSLVTARGHVALAGYDLATGLGTIDASKFVPALAAAAKKAH